MLARSLSVAAVAVTTLPATPANAVTLSPVSEWIVEPSDVRCVAVRKYGEANKPTSLALKSSPGGETIQIAIIRHAYRKTSDQVGATVTIDGKPFETHALGYPVNGNKQAVSLIHLSPDESKALRSGTNLAVSIKGSPDWLFSLDRAEGAWQQMDACLKRLRRTWNMGEEAEKRLASFAQEIVPIQGMFAPRDFPPQAMSQPWKGTTKFLLLIDEKGAVKDCTLMETSGIAVIDSRSCAVVSYKARFQPAVDSDGKPAKSTHARRITWRVIN